MIRRSRVEPDFFKMSSSGFESGQRRCKPFLDGFSTNKFSFERSMLVDERRRSSIVCFDKITQIGRLISDKPGM